MVCNHEFKTTPLPIHQGQYSWHPACFAVSFWPMANWAFATFTDQVSERLREGMAEDAAGPPTPRRGPVLSI
jgi:hypothetical protein